MDEKKIGKCSNCGAEVEIDEDGCYKCDKCHTATAKLCLKEPTYTTPCILCGASITRKFGDFSSKVCPDCKALWKSIKEERSAARSTENE